MGTKEEFVKVRKKDLERLTTEVMQIRDFLPRILNGEVLESFQKLKIVEKSESYLHLAVIDGDSSLHQQVDLTGTTVEQWYIDLKRCYSPYDYIWESRMGGKEERRPGLACSDMCKLAVEEGWPVFWSFSSLSTSHP